MTATVDTQVAVPAPAPEWAPYFHSPAYGVTTDGPSVARFAERLMVASKGMKAGQPFVFAPWQRWALDFALQRNAAGFFQYRQVVLGMPRKTAKSVKGSAIALRYLVGKPDLGREIYSIAGDRQQARLVFGEARWQVLRNPSLERHLKVYRDAIEHPATGSVYRVLSHDGKLAQGLNPFITIADEALALDTPIPTPTGWTTVGEIRVGDQVIGSEGLPVTVTALTPVAIGRPCYRVTFMDGSSVVADAGHKWLAGWGGGNSMRVRRTDELVAGQSRIPAPTALKLPEADLPIDPYLLGLWLGDGSTGQGYISASPADAEFYVAELEKRGVRSAVRTVRPGLARLSLSSVRDDICPRGHEADWYWKVRKDGVRQRECRACARTRERGEALPDLVREPFGVTMRRLGVYEQKAIPAAYLRASFDQRLDLLRGLMDTDGHVARNGSATFVQQSEDVVRGFVELARSLGYRAVVTWTEDGRARTGRAAKVCIGSAGECPVLLPRKVARWRSAPPLSSMGIRSIEQVESVPVRCLTVDSGDHLFMAGDGFALTHNCHVYPGTAADPTTSELWEAMAQGGGARPESLLLAITTAGNNYETLLGRLYRYGRRLADGQEFDPTFGIAWWAAPDGCDWRDERNWHAANPNLALGLADIEEMRSAARTTPEAVFRRYRLNQFVHGGGIAWMDMAAWDRQAVDPGWAAKPGEEIVMAFDGSVSDDATALVAMTTGDRPTVFVLGMWKRPESAPDDWQVPRGEVEQAIEDAFDLYNVRVFQCDTSYWLAEFARWQEKYGRRRVLDFTMSNARMVPAAQEFYSGICDGQLWHSDDPRLTEHVSNAVTHETPRGVSIKKDAKNSKRKIDLAVAACMANDARLRIPRRSGPSAWGF